VLFKNLDFFEKPKFSAQKISNSHCAVVGELARDPNRNDLELFNF
jgi:hypothetical protein